MRLYDLADGTEMVKLVEEDKVVSVVTDKILNSPDLRLSSDSEQRLSCVHHQGHRIRLGDKVHANIIQISIFHGPHDQVLVEILALIYSKGSVKKLGIKISTNEVKARLNLIEAPALDIEWWRSTKGNDEIWRPLVVLLQYKTIQDEEGKLKPVGLEFDDHAIKQKEGFDFFGMVASAYLLFPLLKVVPKVDRNGTSNVMSINGIEEKTAPRDDGGSWEESADFNLSLTLRVNKTYVI